MSDFQCKKCAINLAFAQDSSHQAAFYCFANIPAGELRAIQTGDSRLIQFTNDRVSLTKLPMRCKGRTNDYNR